MNEQVFEYLYGRLKDRQIRFYAFLNKEFNIMNCFTLEASYHGYFTRGDETTQQIR